MKYTDITKYIATDITSIILYARLYWKGKQTWFNFIHV